MRIKWFSLIRVTGLVLVLLYHFFLHPFRGGFIGVDIFFTFSGFLITALLIDEFTRSQKIDYLAFLKRRFYRIVPPLVLLVLVIVPLTLFARNDFRASIGAQIAAALGFMTNYFEIFSGVSYENQFTPHLFVHTWSLAIEVHYYILWGLAVWLISRKVKKPGHLRGYTFLLSSGLFLISFLSMFVRSFFTESFSTTYYSSFTHIFPFFIGSILATLTGVAYTTGLVKNLGQLWNKTRILQILAGSLAVLILLTFTLSFNSIWTYLFGFLLASLATAAMILATRLLHDKTPDLAEPAALTFLADISYSVYLFHWPLFILFKEWTNAPVAALLTTFFSIVLAAASYYFLEPFIAGKTSHFMGLSMDLKPYKNWIWGGAGAFALLTMIVALTAPKLGNFEREMLVDNLVQADSKMALTRQAAEKAEATDYNIDDGVVIFGDSVTVRAGDAIGKTLPDAKVDGAVSRHLEELPNLVKLYDDSNTLPKDVVIALGTNTNDNYKEILDKFIKSFPKGHHLIFVTPYDGNFSNQNDSIAYQTGLYEKQLAGQYDFVVVADWWKVATTSPQIWAGSDYVHFNMDSDGADLFAKNIQDALKEANKKPVKK